MSNNEVDHSELRKCEYRNLLDQIEILNENEETGSQAATAVSNVLAQADKLFGDGNIEESTLIKTDEMLLDAKVVAITSTVLYNVTEAIDCAYDTYDPNEFARRIISKLPLQENDDTDFNWSLLLKQANKILKFPPNLRYMYGPIGKNIDESAPAKKIVGPRRKRQKVNREENAEKKQPEKITTAEKEEDSVDDTVQFLYWCLQREYKIKKEKPVEYMVFVIDPKDFSRTIENMFHLSFLIRDGRVSLTYDDDGLPVLTPVSSQEVKKKKKNKTVFKQTIITIDMTEWKELAEVFEIKESLISKWKNIQEEEESSTES